MVRVIYTGFNFPSGWGHKIVLSKRTTIVDEDDLICLVTSKRLL